MNSIGGINSSSMMTMQATAGRTRPFPMQMASDLFSTLDASGHGSLQKADLQTAFEKLLPSSSVDSLVDELFSLLDSNSDGQVTKDEFSSTLQKVSDELNSQFMSSRISGGMPGISTAALGGGMSSLVSF